MVKIIFVTGAPGTGKTVVADALARKLKISRVIGTDFAREILRNYFSKQERPELHTSSVLVGDICGEDEDSSIEGILKQAEAMKPAIEAIIKRAVEERLNIIIEGIHLIPNTINAPKGVKFSQIILWVPDEHQHLGYILSQGKRRSNHKISNFAKIRAYQNYLVEKAEENKLMLAENADTINSTASGLWYKLKYKSLMRLAQESSKKFSQFRSRLANRSKEKK